jgi:zinc transport system ATP-binding protein
MEALIDVSGLRFGYDTAIILNNIDFRLNRGDFAGIIGPNGSGKSTFLKLLLKLMEPVGGNIRLFGVPISDFRQWSKIGYIAQKSQIHNGLPASVFEVVAANLYAQTGFMHWLSARHKEKVYEALKRVDMREFARAPVGTLSGGQLQRVYLAQVLINDPGILLLDEPAAGMDAQSENNMYELLHRLNKDDGVSIVMVTHDLTAVTSHVNRLYCMGDGMMTEHGIADLLDKGFISGLYGRDVHLHIHSEELYHAK